MITPRRLAVLAVVALVVIAMAGWIASRSTVPGSAPPSASSPDQPLPAEAAVDTIVGPVTNASAREARP